MMAGGNIDLKKVCSDAKVVAGKVDECATFLEMTFKAEVENECSGFYIGKPKSEAGCKKVFASSVWDDSKTAASKASNYKTYLEHTRFKDADSVSKFLADNIKTQNYSQVADAPKPPPAPAPAATPAAAKSATKSFKKEGASFGVKFGYEVMQNGEAKPAVETEGISRCSVDDPTCGGADFPRPQEGGSSATGGGNVSGNAGHVTFVGLPEFYGNYGWLKDKLQLGLGLAFKPFYGFPSNPQLLGITKRWLFEVAPEATVGRLVGDQASIQLHVGPTFSWVNDKIPLGPQLEMENPSTMFGLRFAASVGEYCFDSVCLSGEVGYKISPKLWNTMEKGNKIFQGVGVEDRWFLNLVGRFL